MLKKITILSILTGLLLAPFSFSLKNINFIKAATVISSNEISEDTTWIWEDSPYIISRDIIIREGATLTIEPGVIVKFEQNSLIVRGELNAIGEANEPIIFTSIHDNARGGQSSSSSIGSPASGDWGGIKTQTNGSVNLNYAIINYGGQEAIYQTNNRNIIRVNTAYAQSYYSIGAVFADGGNIEIHNSEIAYNKVGVMAGPDSSVLISDSEIRDNAEEGIFSYNGEEPINAANNWWGYNSGPYHETLNPSGQGNSVSDNVIFDPWVGQGEEQDVDPVITYSQETNYQTDGVNPNKGTAESTELTFKAIYTDEDNDAPESMNIVISDSATTITSPLILDTDAAPELQDNDFTNGEQYAITFTFPKGKYSYYFEASDGGDIVRLPETGALAFETGYSNVAFLPGILGSRMYKQQIFENQLWEPNRNADVEKLYLADTGESIDPGIYTNDIIDEAFGFNIYKKFSASMDDLAADGVIKEWQAMPYDWRMDFEYILNNDVQIRDDIYNITQSIELLAESSDSGQVTLIGHSNGGLLGKVIISKLAEEGKSDLIDKFIMVGAPQLGTPGAITGLLHGGERGVLKGWLPNHEVSRELSENMRSAYNLLPFNGYFGAVDTDTQPIIEFDDSTEATDYLRGVYGNSISLFSELTQFLTGETGARTEPAPSDVDEPNVLDAQLLDDANNIRAALDQWAAPSGVEVVQIAGWGLDTLRGIRYEEHIKQVCNEDLSVCENLPFLDPRPLMTQDGDKTVIIPSATAMDGDKYYLNFVDNNFLLKRNRDHADILEVKSVQDLIKNIIKEENTALPKNITMEKPPVKDSTMRLAVYSPVTIHAYDNLGNHTGVISSPDTESDIQLLEEQIHNSYYLEFGEGKYLGLDTNEEYRVELRGEGYGTFTFEIQEVLGDEVVNFIEYKNIPVSASTTATLAIRNLDTTPEISLDIDGDGTADATLTGNESEDILASIEILKSIVNGLDINKGLKKHILKKLKKAEKELSRGRNEKAIKFLDEIIKKLKKEIKKNLKTEDGEGEEKEHGKRKKEKRHHSNKEKISTEDAWTLIGIVENIKSVILNI